MNNIILQIVAGVVDTLACGNLDYRDGRNGFKSRAQAATAVFDSVAETATPGLYRVRSEETLKRYYLVDALGPDFSCECEDHLRHAPGLCKHILAAVFYHTLRCALAEIEPEPEFDMATEIEKLWG